MRLAISTVVLTLFAASNFRHPQKTQTSQLPPGVLKALAPQAKAYCDQFLGSFEKGCDQTFRANLRWRQLVITPSGEEAILVEDYNTGDCGSAGCGLFLFLRQKTDHFVQILGTHGDVGTLAQVSVLKTVTNGHYDLQRTWKSTPGVTVYRWNGQRYLTH